MTDLPTLGSMREPWREPRVFSGSVEAALPLLAYDGGQVGSVTVRAGLAAAEHRRPLDNCNDSYSIWSDPQSDICVVAVADGVGRDDAAGRAARAATRTTTKAFRKRWTEGHADGPGGVLRASLGDAEHTLQIESQRHGPAYRTTLVAAVVRTNVQPGAAVDGTVARVGDSTAWRVRNRDMAAVFPAPPADGPGLIDAPTLALPGNFSELEVVDLRLQDGEVLALATDGLAKQRADDRARAYLGGLWAAPPSPLGFLGSLAYRRDDRDDDRAAVVIWFGYYETD